MADAANRALRGSVHRRKCIRRVLMRPVDDSLTGPRGLPETALIPFEVPPTAMRVGVTIADRSPELLPGVRRCG
jgi:hypothetical protein